MDQFNNELLVEEMLKRGLISSENLRECQKIQKLAKEQGENRAIEEIALEKEFISLKQLVEVRNCLELGQVSLEEANSWYQKRTQSRTLPFCREQKKPKATLARPSSASANFVSHFSSNEEERINEDSFLRGTLEQPEGHGRLFENKASVAYDRPQEVDFLDSSASKKLIDRCRKIFPPEQLDQLTHYSVLEEIGHGSMGIVYKALHKQEGKIYALKTLPEKVLNDPRAVQLFAQEIAVHRTFDHKHIVHLHKIGIWENSVFLVMEYVLGNNLNVLMQKYEKIEVRQALQLAIAISDALIHAHQFAIVHRDLKPANVLLEEASWIPKVTDFGLAKFAKECPYEDYAFGTPAYMAPEQIVSSRDVDIRADIYSLGCILYYLLSGRRPYSQIEDPFFLFKMKLRQPPRDIREYVPDLHPAVVTLLEKAMNKDPEQRFATPLQLQQHCLDALKQVEKQLPAGYRKSPPRPSEKIHQEMSQKSLAFLPGVEQPLEISSGDSQLALETFHLEMKGFIHSPIGSLLVENDHYEEEFAQTLVSLSMVRGNILHLPAELQQKLAQGEENFLAHVKDLLQREEKKSFSYLLRELRYLILIRGNLLAKQRSLIHFMWQGKQEVELKLEELSRVSQAPKVNQALQDYFATLLDSSYQSYWETFLAQLSDCRNLDEAECYLCNYPPDSFVYQTYPQLRKIPYLKKLFGRLLKETPERQKQIIQKEANLNEPLRALLQRLFFQAKKQDVFLRTIAKSPDLPTLMKHMQRLQQKDNSREIAQQTCRLIETFLDIGGHTSLHEFQTSLNFLPHYLQVKICQLICHRLSEELAQKVNRLFYQPEGENRYKELLRLLHNQRYQHRGIRIYGYPTQVLATKITEIHQGKMTSQTLSIPQEVLAIVYNSKEMEVKARSQNLYNCVHQLKKALAQHKPQQSLLKVLLKILYSFEKINFAKEERLHAISGHQLAREILRYYEDPVNYPLTILKQLKEEISSLLKEILAKDGAL